MSMRLTIEHTDDIGTIRGVLCRRWLGTTPHGVSCDVYVALIAVPEDSPTIEFDEALLSLTPEVALGRGDRLAPPMRIEP